MNRVKILFILCLICPFINIAKSDSQEVYPIWKDKPLFSTITEDSIPKIVAYRGFQSVKNITHPTVIAYVPTNPDGRAVIICPGGAYGFLGIDVEGTMVAEWFMKNGIAAFVLKYRLPDSRYMNNKQMVPLVDALQAIRFVRENADKWGIAKNKIGIMGFSAGGHLASSVSVHYDDEKISNDPDMVKPDFAILVYPVIFSGKAGHKGSSENLMGKTPHKKWLEYFSNDKHVSKNTPQTIIFHSLNDNTVSPLNSIAYFLALKKQQVKSEIHVFSDGDHGYGFPQGNSSETHLFWPELLLRWLENGL